MQEIILVVEELEALIAPDVEFWMWKVLDLEEELRDYWGTYREEEAARVRPLLVNARAQLALALEAEAIANGRA